MVDKRGLTAEMAEKWSIKASLTGKLVDIMLFVADKEIITTEIVVEHFGFAPTTAKRYLRQLTEFGCLTAPGGHRNIASWLVPLPN